MTGNFRGYLGDRMTAMRPVHEGPTGSWPGTVSPADAYYEQVRQLHILPEQQQLQTQQPQHMGQMAEIAVQFDEQDPRQIDVD